MWLVAPHGDRHLPARKRPSVKLRLPESFATDLRLDRVAQDVGALRGELLGKVCAYRNRLFRPAFSTANQKESFIAVRLARTSCAVRVSVRWMNKLTRRSPSVSLVNVQRHWERFAFPIAAARPLSPPRLEPGLRGPRRGQRHHRPPLHKASVLNIRGHSYRMRGYAAQQKEKEGGVRVR